MDKKILIAVIVTLLITAILFVLPRTVVENKPEAELEATMPAADGGSLSNVAENGGPEGNAEIAQPGDSHDGHDHASHRPELSAELSQKARTLAEKIKSEQKGEKFAIFADSLSTLWASAGWYDSAATWAERALEVKNSEERLYRAGSYWYEAAAMMHDEVLLMKQYQQQAAVYLERVVEKNPKRTDARIRLAMTKVEGPNPMEGIAMLRKVLEDEPNNLEALFNMGMLSWQSTQFDKAVERFKKLVSLQPDHLNGQFYLALSYIQLGENARAKTHLQQVKRLSTEPEVLAAIDEYLKQL